MSNQEEGVAYECLKNFVERRLDYYQNYYDYDHGTLHGKYEIVTDRAFARYEDQQIKMALQLVELFKSKPQDLSITNRLRQWLEIELREWLYLFRHLVKELSSGGNDAINDVLHWLVSYRQCQYCKTTKLLHEFEIPMAIEIHTYRLPWLRVKLSGYEEYCQEKSGEVVSSHIAEDEEVRTFYKNELEMINDILKIVNESMTIEPEYDFDTVRIPVNDDQREWLKLHFLNDLKGSKKLLNEQRKGKGPVLYIIGGEGNINMIKYFLKSLYISEKYMCKDCISRPPVGYKCEYEDRKRPRMRKWTSKEKKEFK